MSTKHTFKVGDRVVLTEAPKNKGMVSQFDDYNNSGMVYVAWDGRGQEVIPYYPTVLTLEADHHKAEAAKKVADEKEQNKQG